MASNLGQVFVELSLDDRVYKQKLSEIQPNAVATAKGVETAWKALGTKAGESFDAQRRAAENAYNLIKNHATSTANDILRAEQAKNDKINALNEQQFGKQTSLIQSVKANWLTLTAAATAVYAAVAPSIQAYMESETALMKLGLAMKNQGMYSKDAIDDMVAFSEMVQSTTIFEDDLTKSIMATLQSFGMTTDEVKRSTLAAADMAAFTGKSIETVADLLGKAYAGNTSALSRYGIVIDDTVPKSKRFTEVLEQLEQRFGGSAQASLQTYSGQWKQLKNQFGDIQEVVGLGVLKALQGVLGTVGLVGAAFWTTAETALSAITGLVGGLESVAKWAGMDNVASGIGTVTKGLAAATLNAKDAENAAMANATANFKNMTSFQGVTTAIDNMGKAGKRSVQVDEEAVKAAQKAAEEKKKQAEAVYIKEMELFAKTEEENAKYLEQMTKDGEKAAKEKEKLDEGVFLKEMKLFAETEAANEKALKEMGEDREKATKDAIKAAEKVAEAAEKAAEKRGQYEREIYKDLRGYADQFYSAETALIQSQAQKYKDAGVSQVAIAAWVADQMELLDIKKGQSSDSFVEGVNAGYLEMQRNAMTFGQAGYDIFKTFSESSKTALSDILFQGFKTGTIDAQAVWETFSDTMLRKFTDTISKMVVEAATKEIMMIFSASWSSAAASALSIISQIWNWIGSSSGSGGGGGGGGTGITTEVAYGGLIKGYASGGDSKANDTVLALLSPGEFVMPRSAVNSQTLPLLEMMRQGGLRGYAEGGYVPTPIQQQIYDYYKWAYSGGLSGFGYTGTEATQITMSDARIPDYYGLVILPTGEVVDQRRVSGHTFFGDLLGVVAPAIMGAIATYYAGPWGAALFAAMQTSGTGGSNERALFMAALSYAAAAAGGATGKTALGGVGELGNVALGAAKNVLISQLGSYIATNVLGGGNASFSGSASGDLSWLYSGMASIAPQSSKVSWAMARNGLDYVPYDNFPAMLHRGERVLTKEENRAGRSITFSPGSIVINGSNLSPAQMAKEIVRPLKEELRRLNARYN